jgi:hypothetical protein
MIDGFGASTHNRSLTVAALKAHQSRDRKGAVVRGPQVSL